MDSGDDGIYYFSKIGKRTPKHIFEFHGYCKDERFTFWKEI